MNGSMQSDQRSASLDPDLPTIDLAGLSIHAITEQHCVTHIIEALATARGGWVATPNLDHLRRLQSDSGFREAYASASLRVADGIPLLWASRLQGTPLPGRVAGSDLISSLSAAAAKAGHSLFLLGGEPGSAEKAADALRRTSPSLQVVGTCCPRPGFERDPAQMAELEQQLRTAAPDIIFVALGSPKQERFIAQMHELLPCSWWLGVGISFSFLCGRVRRAPPWMQRSGIEWIHRLWQEPGRLAKRYLLHGLPFALRLLTHSAWSGLRRRSDRT